MSEIITVTESLAPEVVAAARSELELWESLRPELAALATVASLARFIEPELLRSLRLDLGETILGKRISVSAESALWFSSFVESRGAEAITLLPEALQVLRPRLKNNPQLLEDARAIIKKAHAASPDVLQWEENIVYLALTDQTSLLEDEVRRGLHSVSQEARQPLVNWINDMWLRLPPEATSNSLIGKLKLMASGLVRRKMVGSGGSSATDLILDFSNFPTRELGVVLRNDRFVIGDLKEATFGIEVPDLELIEIDVLEPSDFATVTPLSLMRGHQLEIDASKVPLRIRTLAGRHYQLDPRFFRRGIFISYSHADEEWKNRLLPHLAVLTRWGRDMHVWNDRQISVGEAWYPELQEAIADATVAILLISSHYLASPFCMKEEVPALLEREEKEGMRLIPVLLRPSLWKAHRWLQDRQMLPRDGKSIAVDYPGDQADQIFSEIAALVLDYVTNQDSALPERAAMPHIPVDVSRIIKYAPADLIGREEETRLLDDAWDKVVLGEEERPCIVSLVGLGGEGKTSLVAKWAADLAARDWPSCDAAFAWSFYSQGTREQVAASSDLFLKEALTFFGEESDKQFAASRAGAFEKGERLAQLIGRQRSLLILDGLEPLQYSPTSLTPGALKDVGLSALLKALAVNSRGLCVVTTRYSLVDLRPFWPTTAIEFSLHRLSREAGVSLLKSLGVRGSRQKSSSSSETTEPLDEFEKLVEDVKGHAFTLSVLGAYLRDAHGGDIRKRDLLKLDKADFEEGGGSSFRMYAAYERWMEAEGEGGEQAVAVLRLIGLFDRAASIDLIAALLAPPAISGMTESLIGLTADQLNISLSRLDATRLLTLRRDSNGALVKLDAHPMLREYFALQLRSQHPDAWREANRRLYEHLIATTVDKPEPALEDLQPLAQAIRFGCQAGLHQKVLEEVYIERFQRKDQSSLDRMLGVYGTDLEVIANFFDQPWSQVSPNLSEWARAFVLNRAAYDLRALARLTEALEPMRAALQMEIQQQDWRNAASTAGSLSELRLILGEVAEAVREAGRATSYADRSGHALLRINKRTTRAEALLQLGLRGDAETYFIEAERMQAETQPEFPLLDSVSGFPYCELLLSDSERAVWRIVLGLRSRANETQLLESCRSVIQRAARTFRSRPVSLLDTALNHLTRGRAAFYKATLEVAARVPPSHFEPQSVGRDFRRDNPESLREAAHALNAAVDGLRQAGVQDMLPYGLLGRAWLQSLIGGLRGNESVQADLDEAWEIAETGPMKLHMADIHLYRARLFFGLKAYPWVSPQEDLKEARTLIEKCAYWRRKEELEDAEEAAKNW